MKDDFFTYQAQTTPHPMGIEVARAEGSYIFDTDGKAYLDFVAGVSACSLGHRHPRVVNAIKQQLDRYMHVMVYGEYVQDICVRYTKFLATKLPESLKTTYLVNSGTEAIEGALKLARRATGRTEIIAAKSAYHGNTMGSLSLMDYEERTVPFAPLLPDISFIEFNNQDDLKRITKNTAAVVLETIQGGAGVILPNDSYLKQVRERCNAVGALLILDEIQPGFGRTGKLFAFENYECTPDILVIGKGMASGMPVGAFVASEQLMAELKDNPKLGHITTFGGNPVIAAACMATLKELSETTLIDDTLKKEALFRSLLVHPLLREIRGKGLLLALIFDSEEIAKYLVVTAAGEGLLLFWLLFEKRAVRISPPLTITEAEIKLGCAQIIALLDAYPTATVN